MSFSHLVKKLESAKVNEAIIINEILKNTKEILNKKILQKDIANRVHISHSTISRLLNKLGYNSWNDFVSSCAIEEIFYNKTKNSFIDKMFVQSTYLKQYIEKNSDKIDNIVKKIKESKVTILFGERMSGNIAQYISFMMGYKNIMTVHYFFEQQLLPFLGRDILFIILTTTSRTNYSKMLKLAETKGTKTIVIDVSDKEVKYESADMHIKLPLISHVSNDDESQYLKSNTLREFLINIYEGL